MNGKQSSSESRPPRDMSWKAAPAYRFRDLDERVTRVEEATEVQARVVQFGDGEDTPLARVDVGGVGNPGCEPLTVSDPAFPSSAPLELRNALKARTVADLVQTTFGVPLDRLRVPGDSFDSSAAVVVTETSPGSKLALTPLRGSGMVGVSAATSGDYLCVSNVGNSGDRVLYPRPRPFDSSSIFQRSHFAFSKLGESGGAFVVVGGSGSGMNDCLRGDVADGGESLTWRRISSCVDKALAPGTMLVGATMINLPGRGLLLMQGLRVLPDSTVVPSRVIYGSDDEGLTWSRVAEDVAALPDVDFAVHVDGAGRIFVIGGGIVVASAAVPSTLLDPLPSVIESERRQVVVCDDGVGGAWRVVPGWEVPSVDSGGAPVASRGFGFASLDGSRLVLAMGASGDGVSGVLHNQTMLFDCSGFADPPPPPASPFSFLRDSSQISTYTGVTHRYPSPRQRPHLAYSASKDMLAMVGGEGGDNYETFYLSRSSVDAIPEFSTMWEEQYGITDDKGQSFTFAFYERGATSFSETGDELRLHFGLVAGCMLRAEEQSPDIDPELERVTCAQGCFALDCSPMPNFTIRNDPAATTTENTNNILSLVSCTRNRPAPSHSLAEAPPRCFGRHDLVEYIVGNGPVVLSVPHGGRTSPSGIPTRTNAGVSTITDMFTIQLAIRMRKWFVDNLGWTPHVVICHTSRGFVDCNRHIFGYSGGQNQCSEHPLMSRCWFEYNTFLQRACEIIRRDFGRGLFADLHGHAHDFSGTYEDPLFPGITIPGVWIELGQGISAGPTLTPQNDLRAVYEGQITEIKADFEDPNGIDLHARQMYLESRTKHGQESTTLASFTSGANSLGDYLQARGIATCPSPRFPYPSNRPFFDGFSFNIANITNATSGIAFRPQTWFRNDTIDAMMIEVNSRSRAGLERRLEVAAGMAESLWEWWNYHRA